MQRYGQKTSKIPPKWGFSPICDPPRFFFKNQALSLLYPYGALTSCKKLEKTNERSLRYSKTNHRQGRLLRTPSGKRVVQNAYENLGKPLCIFLATVTLKMKVAPYFTYLLWSNYLANKKTWKVLYLIEDKP